MVLSIPRCPRCGSTNTAEILYGIPCQRDDLKERIQNGIAVSGGCRCTDFDALYRCHDCNKDFGVQPHTRRYNRMLIPLTRLVRYETSEDRDLYRLEVEKTPAGGCCRVWSEQKGSLPQEKMITDRKWQEILFVLYKRLYIFDWEPLTLSANKAEMSWRLTVCFDDERDLMYSGTDAFPPYAKELKSMMAGLYCF